MPKLFDTFKVGDLVTIGNGRKVWTAVQIDRPAGPGTKLVATLKDSDNGLTCSSISNLKPAVTRVCRDDEVQATTAVKRGGTTPRTAAQNPGHLFIKRDQEKRDAARKQEDEQRLPPPTSKAAATSAEASTPRSSRLVNHLKPHPPKAGRTPTEEQATLLSVAGQSRVTVVQAGAGTGKTTSLVMLAESLSSMAGQYTAFNTSLVAESKSKFPSSCACNTIHSLAFRAEGRRFAHRLNKGRVRSGEVARMLGMDGLTLSVADEMNPGQTKDKRIPAAILASVVLGSIRRFCQSADTELTEHHIPYLSGPFTQEHQDVVKEALLPFAVKAWSDLSSTEGKLPFAHDHYVKVWQLNRPVIPADYILLDEAQDTSPVMLDVLAKQQAKVILVGDSAQQIYEWRGAIDALAAFPEAPRCYLSQSFRFGPAIASVANIILSHLVDKTKLVLKGLPTIPSKIAPVADPTAILCRTNATAVGHLLQAIGKGKKPYLVGGGADVISFVEAAQSLQQGRPTFHPELACFDSWREVEAYAKTEEGEDLLLMVKLIKSFGCSTLLSALQQMPEEKDADLTISTAHKSKGREWDTVQLSSDFPVLEKSVDSDIKLLYVAATRAKMVLDVSQCPPFCERNDNDAFRLPAN